MIRNVIFDIGGVLIDWNPHYYFDGYFNGDTQKEEFFLTEICGREINRWMDEGMLPADAGRKMSELHPEWKDAIGVYIDKWREQISGEMIGMRPVLEDLSAKGYRMFGLTNWAGVTFNKVRSEFGIISLLEGIVVSAEEHLLKPGPEIYNCLLERYGLEAEECLYTDDHIQNICGAEAVGIKGLLFTNVEQFKKDLKHIL